MMINFVLGVRGRLGVVAIHEVLSLFASLELLVESA
jgi:hypothetical protein